MLTRRVAIAGALGTIAMAYAAKGLAGQSKEIFASRLSSLEQEHGGKLGAYVLDTGSGQSLEWRSDELFCHCSTFKLSLAAFALREIDAGRLEPMEMLSFSEADIAGYSPVIKDKLELGELSIIELAEAIQITSDNAAANILMRRLGGPDAMTQFWRDIGDEVSRIDGYEPDINIIPPGTEENSTSPKAMARSLEKIVLGDVLSQESRTLLQGWMQRTRTGRRRIRAGIPEGWTGLDKTGTGLQRPYGNKVNDIAVLLPPGGGAPIVVTGYFENPEFAPRIRAEDEAVLRKLGAITSEWAAAI